MPAKAGIQRCHAREGGHPGLDRQHPSAVPPLDPGLRRDDTDWKLVVQQSGRPGPTAKSPDLPHDETWSVPLFVAARAERVGRADANMPACRRPGGQRYEECQASPRRRITAVSSSSKPVPRSKIDKGLRPEHSPTVLRASCARVVDQGSRSVFLHNLGHVSVAHTAVGTAKGVS